MATENFLVDSLPAYVKENRDLLIKRVVLGGGTIERMAKQTGIKQDAYLNYLDLAPILQDGKGCGFTPEGTVGLSDRLINTGMIKINLEVCPENLRGKYAEYLLRTAAGEHDLPFEAEIVDGLIAFVNETMEKAVWQSDTTSSDPNLARFDGLLKILAGEADVVTETIAAGTSMIDAVNRVYLAVPENVLNKGVTISLSPAAFRQYVVELVAANLYHYPGPQNENAQQIILPGSNAIVKLTPGLAGSDKIVATWDRNLVYGTDLEGDKEVVDITYDHRAETFAIKVRWNAGTQVAFPDEVVLATLQ